MDYKNEMRKLIDIIKQKSFEEKLADTMDDLLTLTTATKDLSDRINTRVTKSLNANDSDAIKYKPNAKSKAKKVKSSPSITPPPTPKSKNLPTSNTVSSTSTSANDIQNVRNDFMAKQQASQSIKPQGSVGTL
jgi:hypothetical protein